MPGVSIDRGDFGQRPMPWPARAIPRRAIIVLLTIAMGGRAHARTAAEVQALVERAAAHVREVGRERALADFSRPGGGFVDGELYIFCFATDGIVVAHGGNPKLIGRKMPDVSGPSGESLGMEIVSLGLTQGHGWLAYRWPNPLTKRIELKSAFVLTVDDLTVCGSGFYKGTTP
jgi:signal transduction histidine kinase